MKTKPCRNTVAIEFSEIAAHVRGSYRWAGDHGKLAYRLILVTESSPAGQPIPIPFARESDAVNAASRLKVAVERGMVPIEWDDVRDLILGVKANE